VEAQAAILHAAQVDLGRLKQAVEAMAVAVCCALRRSPPTPPPSSGKDRRHSIKPRAPPPFHMSSSSLDGGARGGASDRAGELLSASTQPTLNLLLLNCASARAFTLKVSHPSAVTSDLGRVLAFVTLLAAAGSAALHGRGRASPGRAVQVDPRLTPC
jgi:hypothetical protein